MPDRVEQLTTKLRSAQEAMKNMASYTDLTEKAIDRLGKTLAKTESQLSSMTKRADKMEAIVKDPGTPKNVAVDTEAQYHKLNERIRLQQQYASDIREQQGSLLVPKDTKASIQALETILASANNLIESINGLQQLMNKGLGGPQVVQSIETLTIELEKQARAADMARGNIQKYLNTINQPAAGAPAGAPAGGGGLGGPTYPRIVVPDEEATRAEQARIQKDQELATLRQSYQNDIRYAKARALAENNNIYKFGPQALQGIVSTPITGVSQLTLAEKDMAGVNQQMKILIDRAGNVLPNTTRNMNTFASSVARDVVELTKWTIAIGLIYGPLRKFQEMTALMISNEAQLASAMIVLSDSSVKVADVFNIVADAADRVGDDVGGAIDVFTQAYRATGDMADQSQRLGVASKLMASGMMLAKLSGMGYNESIDHLVGSLKQTNTPLDQGVTLLDKWVKTSLIANVDISTLAIGFSVLGESASAAGLSVDQLNGLLAVIATNMGTSGAEAANAARAIVSGFESSKAIKELNLLGIAVNTTAGDMRPLLDIMTQIQQMKAQGLISDTQFSKLTLAIGGGTRRQAVVAATIQDTAAINTIANQSANAAGAAESALAKKLDTVQTATVRLNNAFQSLAETLGDKGGLLDLFKFILELTNNLVKAIDSLAGVVGKAGPILAMTMVTSGLFKLRPDLMTSALGGLQSVGNRIYAGTANNSAGVQVGLGDRLGMAMQSKGLGQSALIGGAMSAIPAMMNFSAGKTAAGIADLSGGIGGGIIASMMHKSPYLGSVIGTAIAEAFVTLSTAPQTIAKYKPGTGTAYTPTGTEGAKVEDLTKILTSNIRPELQWRVGQNGGAVFAANLVSFLANAKARAQKNEAPEGYQTYAPSVEEYLYQWATPKAQAEFDRKRKLLQAQGMLPGEGEATYFQQQQAAELARPEIAPLAPGLRKTRETYLGEQLNLGKINPTEYETRMTQIKNFETVATGWQVALGTQFRSVDKDIKTSTDLYTKFVDIMTYGSSEQVDAINTVTTQISDLMNKIQSLQTLAPGQAQTFNINGIDTTKTAKEWIAYYQEQLTQAQGYGGNLIAGISNAAQLQKNPVPTLFGQGQAMQGNMTDVVARAKVMETQFLKEAGRKTDEEIDTYRQSLDDFAVAIDDGGKVVFKRLSELGQGLVGSDWLQKAVDEAVANGTLVIKAEVQQPGWGGEVNFPKSMEGLINRWITYFTNEFKSWGVPVDESYVQVVRYEDGQWGQYRGDQKAIAAAMAQVNKSLEKQLEQGMWNIPEGATFRVAIGSVYPPPAWGSAGGLNLQEPPAENLGPGGPAAPVAPYMQPGYPGNLTYQDYADYLAQEEAKKTATGIEGGGGGLSPAERYGQRGSAFWLHNRPTTGVTPEEPYNPEWNKPGTDPFTKIYEALLNPAKQKLPSFDFLGGIFDMFKGMWEKIFPPTGTGTGLGAGKSLLGASSKGKFTAEPLPIITKTSLNLTNTTTLTLDGRVLALSIKKYMINDLNNANAAFGGGGPVI